MLYFFPNQGAGVDAAAFAAAGLAHAWPEGKAHKRETQRGPNGSQGVIVAHQSTPMEQVTYNADKQTWRHVPKSDAWCGFWTDQPPGPEQFARDELLDGHPVLLGDGNHWQVPKTRVWIEENGQPVYAPQLPTRTTLDDDGNWQPGQVIAQYAELERVAVAWWDVRHEAEPDEDDPSRITFDFPGANDAALVALAANYRLGRNEVGMLGLFDNRTPAAVLDAVVDWPTLRAWLIEDAKKKTAKEADHPPAGSSSEPGSSADSPATNPP